MPRESRVAPLREALQYCIAIEQAKGALARRGNVTPDEALVRLGEQASCTQVGLADVAQAVLAEIQLNLKRRTKPPRTQ